MVRETPYLNLWVSACFLVMLGRGWCPTCPGLLCSTCTNEGKCVSGLGRQNSEPMIGSADDDCSSEIRCTYLQRCGTSPVFRGTADLLFGGVEGKVYRAWRKDCYLLPELACSPNFAITYQSMVCEEMFAFYYACSTSFPFVLSEGSSKRVWLIRLLGSL
ncbi:hypothetical protein F4818DRAFT_355089 [Hypoxylon cercidicola]|nr:hypothetical protein F4818DRAFT_355089 [Hypoxylon cercidicola]